MRNSGKTFEAIVSCVVKALGDKHTTVYYVVPRASMISYCTDIVKYFADQTDCLSILRDGNGGVDLHLIDDNNSVGNNSVIREGRIRFVPYSYDLNHFRGRLGFDIVFDHAINDVSDQFPDRLRKEWDALIMHMRATNNDKS